MATAQTTKANQSRANKMGTEEKRQIGSEEVVTLL
jgi:hypothetical protein